MTRILVADDHKLFREGLKQILGEHKDLLVAGEASNGQEVVDEVWKRDFDLVLLDISMPGMSGLDVLKHLKAQKPRLRVLVLSMYPEEQYAVRAIRAGAAGYLTKASAADELIQAIRKICSGGRYISVSIAEKLLFDLNPDTGKLPHEKLSDREYQILCMIASGKTVSRIAEELNLSVKTVSTYRVRILEKMGMGSNAELTNYAIKQNLICLTD